MIFQSQMIRAILRGDKDFGYERAGKWYAEHPSRGRVPLTLAKAVKEATEEGVLVCFGVPGGRTFDAKVKAPREVT